MLKKLQIILIILFSLSYFSLISQEKTDYLVSPDGDTVTIKAIPLAEITTNVESTTAQLKKIEGRIIPTGDLLTFDSIYKNMDKEIRQKIKILETTDDYYSSRNLENDLAEWEGIKDRLGKWKESINERITLLQGDLFEIQVMNAIWNKTIAGYKKGGVPENVLSSEKDLLKRITISEKKENQAITESLRKQNNLTDLSVSTDDVLSDLEAIRKELQSDYFVQDSPAIWHAGDSTASFKSIKKQLLNTKNETIRNLKYFYDSNIQTIYFQLLLFLILWLGLYLLYKVSTRMEDQKDTYDFDNARNILSHNSLAAFILTLFSSIWLYTSMPDVISDLIQLTYILIALFLFPAFIDKKLKKVLYGLLLLFFIDQFQNIFYSRLLFARVVMMIETLFVGWVLYITLHPSEETNTRRFKKRWSFIFKLLPVFYLFLAVSFLGNIFGFINLAVLLEHTVVNALFNLIILILAILVLDWIIIILLRTPFMQDSKIVRKYTDNIEKRLFQIIQFLGVLIWIKSVLQLAGVYKSVSDWFINFTQESYKIGSTTIEIGGIITFFLVILATIVLFRIIKVVLADEIFPRVTLPRGVPGSISMISGYIIVGFGIYIAIAAAGVDLSSFGLVAGALGVGIGFGLQGIVANFIAGLVLAFERPIQIGDTIQIAQMYGDVVNIGVRSTTIKTYEGSEVIIPNSDLITNDVINWTLSDRKKRRDVIVGVAYGSDPEHVMEIMRRVANDHPDVQKIPAPWALFDGFGDSSLNFRIKIWTTMDSGMSTKSEVTVAIYAALQKEGIEIPFPQRDLHIRSIDENADKKLVFPRKKITKKKDAKTNEDEVMENNEMEDDD